LTSPNAEYELVLMLDPEASDERRDQIAAAARTRIEASGNLKSDSVWGMRKLAYEIRQRTEADYRFFRFEQGGTLLDDLNHNLRIADGVLRFRIFKVDPRSPVIIPPPPTPLASSSPPRGGRRGDGGGRRGGPPPSGDSVPEEAPAAPAPPPAAEPAPAPEQAESAPAPEGTEPPASEPAAAEPVEAEAPPQPSESQGDEPPSEPAPGGEQRD
jgi:small subunit ribosomal protein S6